MEKLKDHVDSKIKKRIIKKGIETGQILSRILSHWNYRYFESKISMSLHSPHKQPLQFHLILVTSPVNEEKKTNSIEVTRNTD